MKNSIDIKTHDYFPFHMIVIGVAFLLMAVIISTMYPFIAFLLLLMGIVIVSTHYRVSIDPEKKEYREYLWILGFRRGNIQPYSRLHDIYIRQHTQNIEYGFVSRVSGRKKVYSAALELDDDSNVFIGEHANESKLLKKVNKLAQKLQASIIKSYE
ncbi:hypothetical protein WJR50_14700 [Catalinimonas sp. 4WD22]|uniref:hypothetical protein n=1 Tax=Catalinimonas locisalis TaxID=3133978 RepID=UPI003101055D